MHILKNRVSLCGGHSFIHSFIQYMYQVLHIYVEHYVRCQGFKDDKAGFGFQELKIYCIEWYMTVLKIYVLGHNNKDKTKEEKLILTWESGMALERKCYFCLPLEDHSKQNKHVKGLLDSTYRSVMTDLYYDHCSCILTHMGVSS